MSSSLPTSMKAATWSAPSRGLDKSLSVATDVPLPKKAAALPKDSTLVKVTYVSLNPVDYKLIENPILRLALSSKIPCADFAGTVVSTNVASLKPGDSVVGSTLPSFGAAAEYTVAQGKDACVPVPDGVSPDKAVCIGIAGLTAYQCIAPNVKAGDKVLINGGSGGTGTFGIQIAKALGCYVTTTCSGANVELCKSLGADEVIDYRTEPVLPALKRKGVQYDLVVDNVFSDPALYYQSHNFLKAGRPYVTIAGEISLSGIWQLLSALLLPTVLGGGPRKFQLVNVTCNASEYSRILGWMAEGKVKAIIHQEYDGLEKLGEAFTVQKSGRTKGKLVVKI